MLPINPLYLTNWLEGVWKYNILNWYDCDSMKLYTGIKIMWIVHNSKVIRENIQDINATKWAKNLSTFDFSTFYIKIEHDELKEAMEYIINKALIWSRMEKMSIYSISARWSNNPRSGTTSIDEETLLDMINYLIDWPDYHQIRLMSVTSRRCGPTLV